MVESISLLKAFNPADKITARVVRRAIELRIFARALPASDAISFSLPFIVTESEIDLMVETVRKEVDDVSVDIGRGCAVNAILPHKIGFRMGERFPATPMYPRGFKKSPDRAFRQLFHHNLGELGPRHPSSVSSIIRNHSVAPLLI